MPERIVIKEICEVYDGPHATPKKTVDGPVYLGIDAITDDGKIDAKEFAHLSEEDYIKWTKRVTPQYGDIVFSYEATLGRYALIPKDFYGCLGRRLAIIRNISDDIDTLWLYYYFLSPEWKQFIQSKVIKGSTVNRISVEDFPTYTVPNISINVQHNIANILSKIDKKVALNNNINDNLEQQAYLIFENMMAKAEAHRLKGKYIEAKFLTSVITGKEDANFSVPNGKYKFFTCSNKPLYCNSYAFDTSSILIAGNGDFNVKHYSGKFNAYQRTYVLTPKKEYFALLYLASLYRINSFKSSSSGSIVKFITKSDVENIPVFIPDDTAYLDELNKLLLAQEQNSLENELLVQLRDWLLPMLMNGQATIAD
ncbi:MAG: restriction endonuclease subunit S [Lachnospira sp.]|jgi:type I restriction enzyme S subunit